MIENLWEQSSLGAALEQLAEERGFTWGYVQGFLRAYVHGYNRGCARAMRDMTCVALEGRFGALGDDMLAAIDSADAETLKAVVSHVCVDTLTQVRARLGLGNAPEA